MCAKQLSLPRCFNYFTINFKICRKLVISGKIEDNIFCMNGVAIYQWITEGLFFEV